ncbi:MAG: MarR family transcriptional regulator [Bacilli bacterium]|nr:MarR family transcriptional regulator [Bacilli bacterium]
MLVIDELLKGFTKIKKLFSKNLPTTITPSDHLLLSTIEEEGTFDEGYGQKIINLSKLAEKLEMSKPALTKETKRLEKLGYIKKTTLLHNLRNRYILLTPKGLEKLMSEHDNIYRLPSLVLDKLGEEESKKFVEMLNKINEIIIESNKKGKAI